MTVYKNVTAKQVLEDIDPEALSKITVHSAFQDVEADDADDADSQYWDIDDLDAMDDNQDWG